MRACASAGQPLLSRARPQASLTADGLVSTIHP
jgi:hypothetical protein